MALHYELSSLCLTADLLLLGTQCGIEFPQWQRYLSLLERIQCWPMN
jgi:hypothetical protein